MPDRAWRISTQWYHVWNPIRKMLKRRKQKGDEEE